ncbi:MAG: dihydrofolate reductase [Mucilaginibacter sp.]|nr:dihydrofolate reductase [Mucilaginibacter sp.]
MRKLIVSEWITLDGVFDAEKMGEWFMPYDSESRQVYIQECHRTCDAILFGRKTYEMLAPYWSAMKNNEDGVADKLNSVPKYVVSSTLEKVGWNNSTIIKKNIAAEIGKLKQQPGNEIMLEGSAELVQLLMEANLVDEYRLMVHPVIMGSGKRLFRDGMHTAGLKLVKTQSLDAGVIVLYYQSVK